VGHKVSPWGMNGWACRRHNRRTQNLWPKSSRHCRAGHKLKLSNVIKIPVNVQVQLLPGARHAPVPQSAEGAGTCKLQTLALDVSITIERHIDRTRAKAMDVGSSPTRGSRSRVIWYTELMSYRDPAKQAEYQRLWIKKRRDSYFADKSCTICGSKTDLELDHIDPKTKTMLTARIWSLSLTNPRRIAELAKCQILCNSHHKEKTKAQREITKEHGYALYQRGCRCDECKLSKSIINSYRYL
jgi:hypothetical protein